MNNPKELISALLAIPDGSDNADLCVRAATLIADLEAQLSAIRQPLYKAADGYGIAHSGWPDVATLEAVLKAERDAGWAESDAEYNELHAQLASIGAGGVEPLRKTAANQQQDQVSVFSPPLFGGQMKDIERLRPTMTGDILKSWAQDAQLLIDQQSDVIAGLLVALRDCRDVMEHELDGLKVIQPELKNANAAIASAEAATVQVPEHPIYPPTHTKFGHGQRVSKPKGARWSGVVCGWYSTDLTPEGYAVASTSPDSLHSVQVYPASALEAEGCGACEDARPPVAKSAASSAKPAPTVVTHPPLSPLIEWPCHSCRGHDQWKQK